MKIVRQEVYYQKIKVMIAQEVEDQAPFEGEIEVDESYFSGRRKGKRGRCSAGTLARLADKLGLPFGFFPLVTNEKVVMGFRAPG